MTRAIKVLMMVVIPGALVMLLGYCVMLTVASQMRLEQGPHSRRLARALSSIKLKDVWSQTQRSLRS